MVFLKTMTVMLGLMAIFACGPGDDFDDGGFDAGRRDAGGTDTYVAPSCASHTGSCAASLDLCDGELVVWCDNGQTQCVDCAGVAGGPFHCALWDQSYGHDCLASVGQACAADFPNNTDNSTGCDPATTSSCAGNVCQ